MNRSKLCRHAAVVGLMLATLRASALELPQLLGWWEARPTHAGEQSTVYLHLLREGKQLNARMTLVDIGGYNVPIGAFETTNDTIEFPSFGLTLTFDSHAETLTGDLPTSIVPVYKIPATFKRVETGPRQPLSEWKLPVPTARWQRTLNGPVWAGLAHDRTTNLLLVATERGMLHALDSQTGKTRWTFDAEGVVRGRPAVVNGAVYLASDAGDLVKLDLANGREQWRARVDEGSAPRIPTTEPKTRWDRYGSSVVSADGRVFFASRDKHLYSLDEKTGKRMWRFATGDLMTATPAVNEGRVYAASFDGHVYAVDATSGHERWRYNAKLAMPGDVVVASGRVLVGSRSYDLIALSARDGRELWKRYYWFSWIESPPVVHGDILYTGSSDATGVFAIDLDSGQRRWKASVPGWPWPRVAVNEDMVIAGTVGRGEYLGARNGSLVAMDRHSGKLKWMHLEAPPGHVIEQKLEWGFAASPVIVGDTVFAADLQGRVHAFAL